MKLIENELIKQILSDYKDQINITDILILEKMVTPKLVTQIYNQKETVKDYSVLKEPLRVVKKELDMYEHSTAYGRAGAANHRECFQITYYKRRIIGININTIIHELVHFFMWCTNSDLSFTNTGERLTQILTLALISTGLFDDCEKSEVE